jgi:pilus assembly protein CpaE
LVVSHDARLLAEVQSGCAALDDHTPVLRGVEDFHLAVEAARSWRPQLAILELTGDMLALRNLAEELRIASPETVLVCAFRREVFPPDVAESAVLIEALRYGIADFVRRPVSSADMAQLFDRFLTTQTQRQQPLGKIYSCISNKGGVGKSTLAVNLAVALAKQHPERVLLVDASLQMGVCSPMLDLRPTSTLLDASQQRSRLDETLVRQLATPHASGLDVLAAPPNPIDSGEVDDEIMSRVLTLARRTYDHVIVDTFPVFDRVVMAILDLSEKSFIVLDNSVPTILSGIKFLELLEGVEHPPERQVVVLNRFMRGWGNPTARDVAERLQRPIAHVIPFDRRVQTAANLGVPFLLRAGSWSNTARAMRELTRHMTTPASGVPMANGTPHAPANSPTATNLTPGSERS